MGVSDAADVFRSLARKSTSNTTMSAHLDSLHRIELYADIVREIDEYVGDGRARSVSVGPVRRFLQACIARGVDNPPAYEDYDKHPALFHSTQIVIMAMQKRAFTATTVSKPVSRARLTQRLRLLFEQELEGLLRNIGALFCIHAAGAIVQVGRLRSSTLFDSEDNLRMVLGPVNRLAKFLCARRGSPEYEGAWEGIHEFTFSIVYSLRSVFK